MRRLRAAIAAATPSTRFPARAGNEPPTPEAGHHHHHHHHMHRNKRPSMTEGGWLRGRSEGRGKREKFVLGPLQRRSVTNGGEGDE